ncbi:MAG: Fe-S cluster assembly protein SufB [Malacoplasma sp.]|nr:Fe-S cluster assembly protein SufB [Malacoplasma sp.]
MIDKKDISLNYEYGFNDGENSVLNTGKGLNEEVIKKISSIKKEPEWMLKLRLKAYKEFLKLKNPSWGPDLSFIDFSEYVYYSTSAKKSESYWEKVPKEIKDTFNKLGIIEAEAKFLNGVSAQYDSEIIYKNLEKELEEKKVIFTNIETAIHKYPDLVKKYFGKLVNYNDNKYAALNTAVWSGGSFIYIPKNVKLDKPLQAYFRINGMSSGQFERTLIIVDENASLHYVEGCTAPVYSENNLHAAVVECFVHKKANLRYTTIQNWSKNVLNLVTKRAMVYANANMSWIDGNIGAGLNMKYPSSILCEEYATSDCISVAIASKDVVQDAGAKMIHLAPNTKSKIISKSVSLNGGDTRYRGLVKIEKEAINSYATVECDTLILDSISRSDTIPKEIIKNNDSLLEHEAKVSNISEDQLYYFMSKGISKEEAEYLIVLGFLEPFAKELPMEYAVELNRLIKLDMEGSVG